MITSSLIKKNLMNVSLDGLKRFIHGYCDRLNFESTKFENMLGGQMTSHSRFNTNQIEGLEKWVEKAATIEHPISQILE